METPHLLLVAKDRTTQQQALSQIHPKYHYFLQIITLSEAASWMPLTNKAPSVIVAVGGDGTVLTAARLSLRLHEAVSFAGTATPVMGVNYGHLGFLANFPLNTKSPYPLTTAIELALNPENAAITQETRFFATLAHPEIEDRTYHAFNEFSLAGPESDLMISYTLSISGQFAGHHKGNGVLVSTATGSTAYALSVGGSLLPPDNSQALQVLPVAPFSMTSRPLVVSNQPDINITVHSPSVQVRADGQTIARFEAPVSLSFSCIRSVPFLRPTQYSWFHLISEKLHWNTPLGRVTP